jgi:LDH2 family malate/lactate/ureidoglycolate dehydrogenase
MGNDKFRQGRLFDPEKVRRFVEEVFLQLSIPTADAQIAADVITEAELRGFSCHGLGRLLHYVQRLRHGLIAVAPEISVHSTSICQPVLCPAVRSMINCVKRKRFRKVGFILL